MTSWTGESKNTTTFTPQSKVSGLFYLLQEISSYLLQENGGRIKLQGSIDWTGQSKNTTTFTNQDKS